MAVTLPTDTKFRDPFFQSGYAETIVQNINAFNAASAGGIVMRTNRKIGDFDYEAFFLNTSGLVSRQDQTSTSAATSLKLAQAEIARVKLNRKIGPVDWTRSAFLKPGLDMNAFRVVAGNQSAAASTQEMLSSGLSAAVAALKNQATNTLTVATSGTLDTGSLIDGLAKYGDAASRIAVWVMHSKAYYNLVKEQALTSKIEGIANFNVQTGTPVTLNRPVLVTDDPALLVASGSGSTATVDYFTLGLTADAILLEDSEEEYVSFQEILGNEQIMVRMQGEYAYNLGLKGFTWDVGNGAKNPTGAAIATASNWDKVATSFKDLGGVVIQSK